MDERRPSQTALGAAGFRGAHQVFDQGSIFTDPFAIAILGNEADAIISAVSANPAHKATRMFMAARSRFGEDALAIAIARGVRQIVVLGAGLDTLSLRNPHGSNGAKLFEVDHPATQAWKRRSIASADLQVPDGVSFVGVDLEHEPLIEALEAGGFDRSIPAFFLWLGVVPYLGWRAIQETLRSIASIPKAEVVFDYSEPLENYPEERRQEMIALSLRASEQGEPWLTHFDPKQLATELSFLGFDDQEDLDLGGIGRRYLNTSSPAQSVPGPHVIRARASNDDPKPLA